MALGENTYRLEGFQRLIEDIDPEVVQPDITKTGGISEGREICRRFSCRAGASACTCMAAPSASMPARISARRWTTCRGWR